MVHRTDETCLVSLLSRIRTGSESRSGPTLVPQNIVCVCVCVCVCGVVIDRMRREESVRIQVTVLNSGVSERVLF